MYQTIADAELAARIRKLEQAIARCSDPTVKAASQQRLNKLRRLVASGPMAQLFDDVRALRAAGKI